MRSETQRRQSRINGAKSRGPTSPGGKDKVKLNGLKHGLRAEQVVLPGEDPEEFEAELEGWSGEFRPGGHLRAVLVERAAVASWRLRRCVRAESDMLTELAVRVGRRGREDVADDDDDDEDDEAVALAADRMDGEPAEAVAELKATPRGVDRLIRSWARLGESLEDGPEGWDSEDDHDELMHLLGHDAGADPAVVGPMAVDSYRLAVDSGRQDLRYDQATDVMPDREAEATAARLSRAIARERMALKALRETLVAAPAEAEADDPDADLKFVGVTRKVMLLHRYEMAHERSLRASIKDLVALEKARPRAEDACSQVVA
ncbi:MAG TPA: hypothetical protein VG406_04220, partial [Isosphaeraceae bacterium]|nr:hypothetical protein [Isosphaeraceae bacterium]